MNELNKIVLIFLFVVVISQTVGTGFHEGAHWVQGVLDDRVEPVSIEIYPYCEDDGQACVKTKWTTDDPEEQKAWNAEKSRRELVAIIFDVLGTIAFLIVFAKALIRKGWL